MAVEKFLGVTLGFFLDEFRVNKGYHFRLSWLWDMYNNMVEHSMYDASNSVYMLYLVGCIILAYKYHVYIDARYASLFDDFVHLD